MHSAFVLTAFMMIHSISFAQELSPDQTLAAFAAAPDLGFDLSKLVDQHQARLMLHPSSIIDDIVTVEVYRDTDARLVPTPSEGQVFDGTKTTYLYIVNKDDGRVRLKASPVTMRLKGSVRF